MLNVDIYIWTAGCRVIIAHDFKYNTMRVFFFFQAEDGIRDYKVTGVQTCALPISAPVRDAHEVVARRVDLEHEVVARELLRQEEMRARVVELHDRLHVVIERARAEIGRASCRERV